MTGNEILRSAAVVMGFKQPTSEMIGTGLTVINSVLDDLGSDPIQNLESSPSDMSSAEEQACVYGVAMLLSVAIGDLRATECFSPIYNEKRSRAKGTKSFVTDSLPKGEML